MRDRLLTVIIAPRGIPRPTTKVDVVHPSLYIVHGIPVSSVQADRRVSSIHKARSLFSEVPYSPLPFLTNSTFELSVPANPRLGQEVAKSGGNEAMYQSLSALSSVVLSRFQDDVKS